MTKGKSPEGENRFIDMFAAYSPEKKGDLLEYLKSCDENSVDNLFSGPDDFQKIVDLGVIVPGITVVRIDQSPAPDLIYFVNEKYLLESRRQGKYNMSAMAAEAGVLSPRKF